MKKTILTSIMLIVLVCLSVNPARASLIKINAADLLSDAKVLDFEAGSDGAIAGNDALFAGFGLSNVALLGTFSDGGDKLDSGVSGNALVSRGGTLAISAPSGALDNLSSDAGYQFQLACGTTATQLGFRIVDQTYFDMTVQTLNNNVVLDSYVYNVTSSSFNSVLYLESSDPFDEIRLMAAPYADFGWGVDDLTLAGLTSVSCPPSPPPGQDQVVIPAPSAIVLSYFGLSCIAGWRLRRRKAS